LLALLTFHSASAQSCFPEGIAFSTQSLWKQQPYNL
jgi:hypothetical protein